MARKASLIPPGRVLALAGFRSVETIFVVQTWSAPLRYRLRGFPNLVNQIDSYIIYTCKISPKNKTEFRSAVRRDRSQHSGRPAPPRGRQRRKTRAAPPSMLSPSRPRAGGAAGLRASQRV